MSTLLLMYSVLCFDQDLPSLYLQGGSILPLGPPLQHVGESDPSDNLTLLVALDENGNFMLLVLLGPETKFYLCFILLYFSIHPYRFSAFVSAILLSRDKLLSRL